MLWACLLIYQLLYLGVFFVFLVWRMVIDSRYRRGVPERFGFVPKTEGDRPVVWIHGVSVGEVKAAGSLIRALRETRPDLELVISATTPTGHTLAKELHPELRVIRYPLDFAPCPWLALRRIRPVCVLLMELEVWPNMVSVAGSGIALVGGAVIWALPLILK